MAIWNHCCNQLCICSMLLVYFYLQEQLHTVNHYFTLVQCSSHTFCWREGLVPCTPQNLTAALQWVQSLQTVGSTNIISALKAAVFVPSAEAVYLLTDGNSDQSITQILSEMSQWPRVPVHTVSFNHDDGRANKLLAQLAIATGGQFHSHHSTSTSGPSPYKVCMCTFNIYNCTMYRC